MPLNSATKTFAILAKRGAGKTYTASVLAEEFYKNNIPFIVFDPIDVWWGLRLDKNGKDKGLPVVVFGLDHADIQLTKDMGRDIARAVVKDNISCVISTFGMPKSQQRHLIAEFSDELLNINRTPRHVFIEEAHEFVPQRVMGDMGKCFNSVSNLVVMGRNRGIGVTLINQRASTINKDVLTQLDSLLAFRNVSPQDRKAMKDWVEYHSAEGDFDAFMQSLPTLPTGEGWIWSPEFLNKFERIKIRQRETFHPDREKLGTNFEMPELSQIDVQTFIEKFSSTIQSKKQVDTKGNKPFTVNLEPEKEAVNVTALKNEYESKILQKDVEIRKLQSTIDSIRSLLGVTTDSVVQTTPNGSFSTLNMWIEKLGNSMPSRILKFLADNYNNSFTREQLGLALRSSYNGVSNTAVPLLKRNNLIKEENQKLRINLDLLK